MDVFRRLLCLTALVLPTSRRLVHAQLPARAVSEQVRAFYVALARHDTTGLDQTLAKDLVWTVGLTGAQIGRAELLAAAARPQVPAPTYRIDSLRVYAPGRGVAVAEYARTDTRTVENTPFTTRWRAMDIFVTDRGRWSLARHTQVWLVAPVTGTVVDSAACQPFVGQYQIAPGYVGDVHWEGGRLVATASGQSVGAELVPVSLDAFSSDSVGSLMVFERDAAGRVLGYVQGYPDGRVIHAVRLP